MSAEAVRDELAQLAALLVDRPEQVSVDDVPYRGGRVLTLQVAEDDLGMVIGRQGRTVSALRTLLELRGERDGEQYELEIADETAPLPERVVVGRVLRPHGVRGELLVEILSEIPGRFAAGGRLWLAPPAGGGREVAIAGLRSHSRGALLRLAGIDDRDAAAGLAGARLEIDRRLAPPPPDGSYYYFELAGCRVSDQAAGELGVVDDVVEDGGGLLLEITSGDGRRLLVPFVGEFVAAVDVAGRRIELRLPAGLVESCTSM